MPASTNSPMVPPLAVLLGAGQARHHRLHLPHDAVVHQRVRERQAAKVVGRDVRDLAGLHGLHAHAQWPPGEDRDGAHPRRGDLAPDRLGSALVDDQGPRLALEQA
jgi:hypothetical protein